MKKVIAILGLLFAVAAFAVRAERDGQCHAHYWFRAFAWDCRPLHQQPLHRWMLSQEIGACYRVTGIWLRVVPNTFHCWVK